MPLILIEMLVHVNISKEHTASTFRDEGAAKRKHKEYRFAFRLLALVFKREEGASRPLRNIGNLLYEVTRKCISQKIVLIMEIRDSLPAKKK
jgi:hypothetical protein